MLSIFIFLCFLWLNVFAQTSQRVALCALQASLGFPKLKNWQTCDSGWTDTDIAAQKWQGISWGQDPDDNSLRVVVGIDLSGYEFFI